MEETASPPGSLAGTLPADWYDGVSAVRHEGTARLGGDTTLVLEESGQPALHVPLGDLVSGGALASQLLYHRISLPDFRLRLPLDLPPDFAAALPQRRKYGGWVDRMGLGKAVIAFTAVSAAAVALFMTAPEWLGPMVPPAWERQIGDAMVGDLGGKLCHTPAGDAAMAKMLAAVDPAETKVRAGVANSGMVNAVALPGGQVMLFDGLVQQAETPEELAGVLGHEVGHVRERHVMTAILRQFGLSILLAGADSGIGNTAFGIASLGYSREAEREADEYARARMAAADISPLGAAAFFERLGGGKADETGDDEADEDGEGNGEDAREENALIGWIASHPAPGERAKAYRDAASEGKDYPPVLTDEEFAAIQSMCDEDEDVEEFDLF